ncbi:Pyruvate:ferredoxin oxidoreductase or related 2-oxoacid:ferredoxin oxidoreductase, gamma subunit, partial [Dysosmobacter welbionis]
QAPQGDAQGQVPVRQPHQTPVQIHLVPGQGCHLPDLHPQLPTHPKGKPHRGAALRLEQLPHQKTVHLLPREGVLLPSLRQIVGENGIQSGDGDAADPGHIGPVVGFQMADDEVVPQIHQADAAQPRPVQSFSGQAGNGLRRHLLPAAVRDHHEGSRRVGALRLPAQAVLGLRLQRDGPVRQPELMGRKVHIVP